MEQTMLILENTSWNPFTRIAIFSDSQTAIKPLSNVAINSRIVNLFYGRFRKVFGHCDISENCRTCALLPEPSSIQIGMSFIFSINQVVVVQQVVCWLIRRKARVRVPGLTSKRNTKSISSAISSQQISGKNSECQNKIAIKSFSKNLSFEVGFKLQVPPLMYKINAHNISGVRNQVNNPN